MQQRTAILATSCAAFLGLGMVTAGVGPALPDLAAQTGSSAAAVGGLFSVLFLGALLAQPVAGLVLDRLGAAPVLLTGLALLGGGTLLYTAATSLPLLLLAGLITGVGHGAVDTGITVNIAGLYPEKRVSILNWLNVFFGVGAVAAPALAALTLAQWQTALPGLWAGAIITLLQLPLLAWYVRGEHSRPAVAHEAGTGLYRVPLLWLFALFILVYVGFENAIAGWTSVYVVQTAVLTAENGALLTGGFWLALTLGRLLVAGLGGRMGPQRVLWLAALGALVGAGLLLAGVGQRPLTVAATLLLGFACGPIFPTTISLVTAHFHTTPGRAAGAVIACASIGGATLPNLHGRLLEGSGPPVAALHAALLAAILLLLWWRLRARLRRADPA